METRASHDETENTKADSAFADMFVSIYSRSAGCLRIVDVNRHQTFPRVRDDASELMKCFAYSRFVADVVTRCEQVRCVEAHSQPLRFPHVANNVRQLLEAIADARALAGC